MGFRRPLLEKTDLKNEKWVVAYWKRNYNDAEKFFEMMVKGAKDYGIKVYEPIYVEFGDKANADIALEILRKELKGENI